MSLSPCGVVCCGVVCCGVVWCGVCGVVFGAAWHAEKAVDSKRPRVYRHHARICYHMRAWCRYTRGRFESTHGGFLDGHTGERERGERREEGHRQFCLPRNTKSSDLAPQVHRKKPLDLTHSKFENRSRTTRSRVLQSFALPDEPVHFQQS